MAVQAAPAGADRAEAELWSVRMEAYDGPAQPAPTICSMPQWRALPLDGDPPTPKHADLVAGGKSAAHVGRAVTPRRFEAAGAQPGASSETPPGLLPCRRHDLHPPHLRKARPNLP
jgi:hypothetical protein